jgi:short-subunit dehydrogenase
MAGVMDADRSAKLVIDAFARRVPFYVPGALYRVAALAMKLAPQALVMHQIERIYRGALLATQAEIANQDKPKASLS